MVILKQVGGQMKVRIHADWRRLEAAVFALRRDSGEVLVGENSRG